MRFWFLWLALGTVLSARNYEYAPAPVDNPLKGFVPYVEGARNERFPCSMEFRYFAMNDLMKGWGDYDWTSLEETLEEVKGRGRQLCFRVYAEYPGKENGVPEFLQKEGVKVIEWDGDNTYKAKNFTPDYEDARFRKAMRELILAMGTRYDGDVRIGFITAGLLGSWGEWHNHPRSDLAASKSVQEEVMRAYAESFKTTKVLLRYPAGDEDYSYASNAERPFGYHDDSFAWATLDTGKKDDSWYFVPRLKQAGVEDKWRRFPIGGELRPELWKGSFTDAPHPKSQDFEQCVAQTHVTWLMDTGLSDPSFELSEERKKRASNAVGQMGYEVYVSSAEVLEGQLSIVFENRGVAPFYYNWPVELAVGEMILETGWTMPIVSAPEGYQATIELPKDWSGKQLRLRVQNPMEGGRPLRFANKEQGDEWMELGEF